MIIGICGKSGSGKSYLSSELKRLNKNIMLLNIDEIGHNALEQEEVRIRLREHFGVEILNQQQVDRKVLGDLVFNSREKMAVLSDITWKYMEQEIDRFIAQNKDKTVILDWILLPITKYFKMCDKKILVNVPYGIREKRAILRDGITKEKFALRENASIVYCQEDFDCILSNETEEQMKGLVKKIYDKGILSREF